MIIKRCFSLIMAVAVMMSCVVTTAFPVLAESNYGTVKTGTNGSLFLYFGNDSITGGSGKIKVDDTVNDILLPSRPDGIKPDSNNTAALTLPFVDLSGKDFDKIDIIAANNNVANVVVKVGDTEIASFENITNGSWDSYNTFTGNILSTNVSGNLTLNITYVSGKNNYMGNYAYVKIYKSGVEDAVVPPEEGGNTGEESTESTSEDNTGEGPTEYMAYKDESLSFEERAADLVSRMTTAEKLTQVGYQASEIKRLGVRKYDYWKEALHGVARQGKATSFPTALSMSNTWNRNLIQQMADVTSTEARVKTSESVGKGNGWNLSYWSPTVNMARDPRWGRNEESYGEDPYLAGQIGVAFVKGMQGDDPKYLKTIATLKHFAANNNETNRRSGSSVMNEFNLRNYYTRVFKNITEEVMPASFMSSYNAITLYRNGDLVYNSKPSAANSYLLQSLLRRNWGFDGYVTTDCGAGEDLIKVAQYQNGMIGEVKEDKSVYLAEGFKSGMNVECYLSGGKAYELYGAGMIENGHLDIGILDRAVYELFLQRFRTGEFDSDGGRYSKITASSNLLESKESVAVAEAVAEETFVLLENKDSILPLKNVKNIAVVGNMANVLAVGDYKGSPTDIVKPIEGIKAEFKSKLPDSEVNYLGEVLDDTLLYNVKSIKLVKDNGKKETVDLSKATEVTGMKLQDGKFIDVTQKASALIPNINFEGTVKVEVEMATGARIGGSVNIAYGKGGTGVASALSKPTADTETYEICEGEYTGTDGGYNGKADMYITATPTNKEFSVAEYKTQLDSADVIIAYAGTIPKQDDLPAADSSESKDRSNINLPAHQAHVQAICDAYPDKTIVVMSTVGQINVEPFKDKCKAILWTSYNGQTQGTALGKVLTGEVSPSGRLTTTWYKNDDVNKMEISNKNDQTIGGITGKFTDYNIQAEGTNPGHTYQYYKNEPVYSFGYGLSYTNFEYSNMTIDKTNVDANGEITFTVDVKNGGSVDGKEVVQLYVAHPKAGIGNVPKKQLKGFEKVDIKAGETKTVTIKLNVKDMYLFDETEQKDIVPTGTYTAYIGKNADDTALSSTFTVSGEIESKIKTVKAIPTGIVVSGYIEEDGKNLESKVTVNSDISVVMTDEKVIDMADASAVTMSYSSSNEEIANVDGDGKIISGVKNGVAVITASATVNGETKTTSYPIVNQLSIKPTSGEIQAALAQIEEAYNKIPRSAYSDANLAEVDKIYNDGKAKINAEKSKAQLPIIAAQVINDMSSVVMDKLEDVYSVSSVNPNHIVAGVIDYSEEGIGIYNGADGTITNSSPKKGIMMKVADENGASISDGKFVWQIKKFDNSVRKVADINSETGELTVYGNGIVQIIAADVENMKCGTLMVQVNTQIEGEYADAGNGANLNDSQSGTSGGFDAGSTGDAWIEYKSVKLSNLDKLIVRYAGKNDGTINVSLNKSSGDGLIASKGFKGTGGWSTWAEAELNLDSEAIYNAQKDGKLDKYGCATIYIQTNSINLDYFRLEYIKNNDDEPYVFEKVMNKANGKVKADLKYRGSTLATDAAMIVSVKDAENKCKNISVQTVKGTGDYEFDTGAEEGDLVQLFVWDSLIGMKPISKIYSNIWKKPVDSEIVVYTLGDGKTGNFDYTPLTGGEDGTVYSEINGLKGYGKWTVDTSNAEYTYTDVNDNSYEYKFTKAWKAGQGNSSNKRNLILTPKAPCKVTAVFVAPVNTTEPLVSNCMKVKGGGNPEVIKPGTGGVAEVSINVTDITDPVVIYGGKLTQSLHAIIVEYYGKEEATSLSVNYEETDRPVRFSSWEGTRVVLTENESTGETKVFTVGANNCATQLNTDYFYESDVPNYNSSSIKINTLAEYNGRLYAGCDDGLVIVFTECVKCYKLKKVCNFDIKDMVISGDIMSVSDGKSSSRINMTDIGGESIEADEAYQLMLNGAVMIDVRSAEEFAEKSVEGSINVPLDNIKDGLKTYGKDTSLIFCCGSGSRANQAVKVAKEMGFTNIYNLGSISKMI